VSDGVDVRIFFRDGAAIEGSHARTFPQAPTVGQTLVFGRPTGTIAVYRVVETGFFVWEDGASLWILVIPVEGTHEAPTGYYDPMAKPF
jgi:hypothetical protein